MTRPSPAPIAILAAFLVGACTAGSPPPGAPGSSGTAGARATAAPELTLRLAGAGVDNLDPALAYTTTSWFLARGIFRTLVAYVPAADGTAELVGDLAQDAGTLERRGARWTFRLRPGLRYGPGLGGDPIAGVTGEPIVCEDVKRSFERLLDPDTAAAYPFYYSAIRGGTEMMQGRTEELAGLSCEDERTIVFDLQRPVPDLPARLTLPATTPFPEVATRAPGGAERLPATGPYHVARWRPGRVIRLERNPAWEAATDEVRRASADAVRWRLDLDTAAATRRVMAGSLDALVGVSLRGSLLAEVVEHEASSRLIHEPSGCLRYLFLNTERPPFDDLEVRRAVAVALDRYAAQRLEGGPGTGTVASSIVPPDLPGHLTPGEFNPFATPHMTGDLDRARRMLTRSESSAYQRERIVLIGEDSAAGRALATSVGSDLERIGFARVRTRLLTGPELIEAYASGDAHIGTGGSWCKDYEDAGTILRPLLHGDEVGRDNSYNFSRLHDVALDAQIERAEAATDEAARARLWTDANRRATELAALIPYSWGMTTLLYGPRLRQVRYLGPLTHIDWTNVTIETGGTD